MLAQFERSEPDLTGLEIEYMHGDHLGGVSFTTRADGTQPPDGRVQYDPFGNRIDLSLAPRLDSTRPMDIPGVTRGFTGHEMEDDLGVINRRAGSSTRRRDGSCHGIQ